MKYFEELARQNNVSKWDLFYMNDNSKSISFIDTKLENIENNNSEGIGIRVIRNGKLGFTNASSMDNKIQCLKNAIDISNYGEELDLDLPTESINDNTSYINPEIETITLEEMVEQGKRIVDYLKAQNPDYMPHSSIANNVYEVKLNNSNGISSSYRKSSYVSFFGCSLIEEGNFIKRNKVIIKNDKDIYNEDLLNVLLREMEILQKKADISKGLYEVVFTPNAIINIMLAFDKGVSGSTVCKNLSPLAGRLTEQIFDKRFNIVSDPSNIDLPQSVPFDDEGIKSKRLPLVTEGYLENYILDLKSANKLDMEPNGHGYRAKGLIGERSHSSTPTPVPSNLQILPGTIDKEDMISSMKNGIVVDDIMGILMSNLISGEFSGNISTGVRVIDGKRTGRVKDCMISGNIYELFKDNLLGISKNTLPCVSLGFSGIMPYIHLKDIFIS